MLRKGREKETYTGRKARGERAGGLKAHVYRDIMALHRGRTKNKWVERDENLLVLGSLHDKMYKNPRDMLCYPRHRGSGLFTHGWYYSSIRRSTYRSPFIYGFPFWKMWRLQKSICKRSASHHTTTTTTERANTNKAQGTGVFIEPVCLSITRPIYSKALVGESQQESGKSILN